MHTAMILVHVLACIAVIMVVLLSKGKGADLGAAFGGSSQTVFGSQGAGGVLTKLVAICVGVFMMTSLGLAYMSTQRTQATVMGNVQAERTFPGATGFPTAGDEDASGGGAVPVPGGGSGEAPGGGAEPADTTY